MPENDYLNSIDHRLCRVEETNVELVEKISGISEKVNGVSEKVNGVSEKMDTLYKKVTAPVLTKKEWIKIIGLILSVIAAAYGINVEFR